MTQNATYAYPNAKDCMDHLVRDAEGIALVVNLDGRVIEANNEGWRMIYDWRNDMGRNDLPAWLTQLCANAGPGEHPQGERMIIFQDKRAFCLRASALEIAGDQDQGVQFFLQGDEVLSGYVYLHEVQRHYGLARNEAEMLSMMVRGQTIREMADMLGWHPHEVKVACSRMVEKIRDFINRGGQQLLPLRLTGAGF